VPTDTSSPADRYARWIAEQEAGRCQAPASAAHRFSVLVPVGAGEAAKVGATLAALRLQTGVAWECRLGFAPAVDAADIDAVLRRADARVSGTRLATAERGAMLAALMTPVGAASAGGDLLLVLDPGDRLAPGALAALAAAAADIAHGDEDRIGRDGQRREPVLKPGWSPDLLHAFNYFGRPTALRRDLVEHAGGFAAGLGAGAEWDLHLRLAADSTVQVARVPEVLCHRPHDADMERPAPGCLAAEDHRAAIAAHWRRLGLHATVTTRTDGTQRSRVRHAVPPLVSIIVPDGRDPAQLAGCLAVLAGQAGDARPQVIVVGGVDDPVAPRLGAAFTNAPEPYTRAAACNAGARAARGTLLLFLDSDLRPSAPDWLAELVDFALRPGVGVAGTLRVDGDGEPLDAGFHLGADLCTPLFRGGAFSEWGPFGSALVPRTLAVVAGGCQMVRRDAFAQAGGFDETYGGAYGDTALCLAVRAAGWRVVHTPFAAMVRHAPEDDGIGADPEPGELDRLASDIRRLGYDQDPFFHPALDAGEAVPRLRVGAGDNTLAHGLRRRVGELPAPLPLDLANDAEVAEATGMAVGQLLWPAQHGGAIDDIWSAARWCLDLLRRRPDLRRRFPDALSAGADGTFAQWLDDAGAGGIMLPPAASRHVRAALAAGIADQARQAVLVEAGLAGDMARAFLPSGRDRLFSFLLQRDGRALRREEVWWLALECAEDPTRELALSHRFNPVWQAMFPDGLTVFGQERFAAWLRAVHRIDAAWIDPARCCQATAAAGQVRLAWRARDTWQRHHPNAFENPQAARALLCWLMRPDSDVAADARNWLARQPIDVLAEAMATPGINVVGHFGYPSGIRTSVLSVVAGLRRAGLAVSTRDVPVETGHDGPGHAAHDGFELHDTTLLHIQPEPFFARAFDLAGLHARTPRSRRIGYWYWELEAAPASWLEAVAQVDEIWVATRFIGDALRSRFDIPVLNLMPGVELPPFRRRTPEHFAIPTGHFSLLFAFHMLSGMERKNPLGLIRAFRIAFSPEEPVVLVIKTSFGDRQPGALRQLQATANAAGARVMVIDRVFTADETVSLMDACDAYVSLHRSEGLGLTMAEAMLLAKPVIATGYSGNTDFMNATNSLLVDYRLVAIDQAVPPYGLGGFWAEPSEAHAAALMRQVWENRTDAAAMGIRAQADIRASLSVDAAGRRMAARLAEIGGGQAALVPTPGIEPGTY